MFSSISLFVTSLGTVKVPWRKKTKHISENKYNDKSTQRKENVVINVITLFNI